MEVSKQVLQVGGIVLLLVVGVYLVMMYFGKEEYMDIVAEIERENDPAKDKYMAQDVSQLSAQQQVVDHEKVGDVAAVMAETASDPMDLLPHYDEASAWAESNPVTSGTVHDQNFLEAGYHYGVDTQGSSMRIASFDIRSTPPIKKEAVSIFNNSSYTPDPFRKHFEIGA